MVYMINFMPPVVLTSKLCPKNMESTVYALLAGFQNFGQQVAKSIGVYMIGRYRIKTEEPCNFDGLTGMIVLGHMVLPALTIPLTFFMLPNKRLDEELENDGGKYLRSDDDDDGGGDAGRTRSSARENGAAGVDGGREPFDHELVPEANLNHQEIALTEYSRP